jgi:hypothetical protein
MAPSGRGQLPQQPAVAFHGFLPQFFERHQPKVWQPSQLFGEFSYACKDGHSCKAASQEQA